MIMMVVLIILVIIYAFMLGVWYTLSWLNARKNAGRQIQWRVLKILRPISPFAIMELGEKHGKASAEKGE